MTRRRWIADEVSGSYRDARPAAAEHLARVLRARIGQEFDIATASNIRRGRITSIENDRVEFELGEHIPAVAVPNITLVLSIFTFDRMEWAIEKCTELGVEQVIPVIDARTEAHLIVAAVKRTERWQRIARQAAEQSRRSSPPQIFEPMRLKNAVSLPASKRIVLSESEQQMMLKDVLQSDDASDELILAIGHE